MSDTPSGRLFFQSETFSVEASSARVRHPRVTGRSLTEPAREVPIHAECDVLVVGGGPAGTAAAVAAARLGARTMLIERYNHLGGLSTGGLVIWIDRMTDWSGQLVIRGFAEEFLARLPLDAIAGPPREAWGSRDAATAAWWALRTAAFHGTITHSPTADPEWMKATALEMVLEAGAEPLFHAWGAQPVMEGDAVRGAIFESKQGRRAILAKVVVDATGDGDLFHRAGASCSDDIEEGDIHHAINTSWMFGGVDMEAWLRWRAEQPQQFADFLQRGRAAHGQFEKAFVSWRNDVALFMGPRMTGFSAVAVDDLTEVEIRSHRLMLAHLEFYRAHAPGFTGAWPLLSAPQIGVRHGRRLVGMGAVTRAMWDGRISPDEIGVSPPLSPRFLNVSIPYGALVPAQLDGLLAPGRHLSCDATSHSFLREIPQCWLTGQAAGIAAALSAYRGVAPRSLPVRDVQRMLLAHGGYLSSETTAAAA